MIAAQKALEGSYRISAKPDFMSKVTYPTLRRQCDDAARNEAQKHIAFASMPQWAKAHQSEMVVVLEHYAAIGAKAAYDTLKSKGLVKE